MYRQDAGPQPYSCGYHRGPGGHRGQSDRSRRSGSACSRRDGLRVAAAMVAGSSAGAVLFRARPRFRRSLSSEVRRDRGRQLRLRLARGPARPWPAEPHHRFAAAATTCRARSLRAMAVVRFCLCPSRPDVLPSQPCLRHEARGRREFSASNALSGLRRIHLLLA